MIKWLTIQISVTKLNLRNLVKREEKGAVFHLPAAFQPVRIRKLITHAFQVQLESVHG